jgi:pimeloyl-ACP methyl ester carboxylesterase
VAEPSDLNGQPAVETLAEDLGEHHTFIRYDERGNGLSDWDVEDMSLEAWVHDLETVVDAAGVERFALMGISQGGPVAITYAVRHPKRVSHLVLCGAYARGRNHREQSEDEMEARRALKTLVRLDWGRNDPACSQLFTNAFIPENATQEHRQWFNDLQRIATGENAARIMEVCDDTDVRSLLSSVRCHHCVCDRDRIVPSEEGRILAAEYQRPICSAPTQSYFPGGRTGMEEIPGRTRGFSAVVRPGQHQDGQDFFSCYRSLALANPIVRLSRRRRYCTCGQRRG